MSRVDHLRSECTDATQNQVRDHQDFIFNGEGASLPKENTSPGDQSEGGGEIDDNIDAELWYASHTEQYAINQIPNGNNDELSPGGIN